MSEKQTTWASVGWTVGDVLTKAEELGIEMNEATAAEFLDRNEKHIIDRMVVVGWEAMEACMDYEKHEKDLTS